MLHPNLNVQLDKYSRLLQESDEKFKRELKKNYEKDEECDLLKRRLKDFKEKTNAYDCMKKLEKNDELEVLKEMNDLREIIEELKVERDRIIDKLRENNILNEDDLRLREVSSESLLGYVKVLIDEKNDLKVNLSETEAELQSVIIGKKEVDCPIFKYQGH